MAPSARADSSGTAAGTAVSVDAPSARLFTGDAPATHRHHAVGQRDGELGLVGRQEDGGPVRHRVGDELAEECARGGIEAGVRLVEQPESRTARQQRGEGDPAALAGRQPAGRRRAQTPGQPQPLERGVGALHRQAEGTHGELDVLRRAELVVERGGMPQKPDVAAHGGVIGGQVDAEDGGLARRDRQQPGAGPQQAGLAGAVGTDDDDDLTLVERQIDPGKGGEAAGECDRGTKVNDRGHGLPHHGRGGGCQGSKRGSGGRSGPPPAPRPARRPEEFGRLSWSSARIEPQRTEGAAARTRPQRMWASAMIGSSERARSPAISALEKSRSASSCATRRPAVSRSAGLNSPIRR